MYEGVRGEAENKPAASPAWEVPCRQIEPGSARAAAAALDSTTFLLATRGVEVGFMVLVARLSLPFC